MTGNADLSYDTVGSIQLAQRVFRPVESGLCIINRVG